MEVGFHPLIPISTWIDDGNVWNTSPRQFAKTFLMDCVIETATRTTPKFRFI
jgi:hypothetical protein